MSDGLNLIFTNIYKGIIAMSRGVGHGDLRKVIHSIEVI